MFIMTTATYPPGEATKISKKFMTATAKPLPPFVKRLHVLMTAKADQGLKTCGIYEIDDSKIKEGIMELTRYYVQYYDIKGFQYEIEPMLTAAEAIPLLNP
jgi:hypothetical protein